MNETLLTVTPEMESSGKFLALIIFAWSFLFTIAIIHKLRKKLNSKP